MTVTEEQLKELLMKWSEKDIDHFIARQKETNPMFFSLPEALIHAGFDMWMQRIIDERIYGTDD